jgi:uncharacterized membrane protein
MNQYLSANDCNKIFYKFISICKTSKKYNSVEYLKENFYSIIGRHHISQLLILFRCYAGLNNGYYLDNKNYIKLINIVEYYHFPNSNLTTEDKMLKSLRNFYLKV